MMAATRLRGAEPRGLTSDASPFVSERDREARRQAKRGSDALLQQLLRYGVRYDRHLGLGAARFHALCAEQGVEA